MFSFFDSPEEKQRLRSQQEAQQALLEGKLPPNALKRIEHMVNSPNHLFTSALSVNENLLLKDLQVIPVAQVIGTAFFKNPLFRQSRALSWDRENDFNIVANEVRAKAVDRLLEEALALKAHGVVDVTIKESGLSFKDMLIECTLIGTAVRLSGGYSEQRPFLCNLSGADFYKLMKSGYTPKTIVFGSYLYSGLCDPLGFELFYFIYGNSYRNGEETGRSQVISHARSLACSELCHRASLLHSDGIVGVNYKYGHEELEYDGPTDRRREAKFTQFLVYFSFMGTTIVEDRARKTVNVPSSKTIVSLNSRSSKRNVDDEISNSEMTKEE